MIKVNVFSILRTTDSYVKHIYFIKSRTQLCISYEILLERFKLLQKDHYFTQFIML